MCILFCCVVLLLDSVLLSPPCRHIPPPTHTQECVYHKAQMDKKSSATLAKLARQAGNMYAEVSSLFNAPSLVQHFERSWVAHTQMKVREAGAREGGEGVLPRRRRQGRWLGKACLELRCCLAVWLKRLPVGCPHTPHSQTPPQLQALSPSHTTPSQ